MSALQETKQLIAALHTLPKSAIGDYFLLFADALEKTIEELPAQTVAKLFPAGKQGGNGKPHANGAANEPPSFKITPFEPLVDSIALCRRHVVALAQTDYARSHYDGKLETIMVNGLNAVSGAMKKEYGNHFAPMEPLFLHHLALNFNAPHADWQMDAEIGEQERHGAKVILPSLATLKTAAGRSDEKGIVVSRETSETLVEMAQGVGHKFDRVGRKSDIQEDHAMLASGDVIPAGEVPGRLLRLFRKAAQEVDDAGEERGNPLGGTTACVACLSDGTVTVANTGDSRAFMLLEPVDKEGRYDPSRDIEWVRLSADHRPDDAGEICRVQLEKGTHIMGHPTHPDYSRVLPPQEDGMDLSGVRLPGLGMARAFGDKEYGKRISWYPDISQTDLKPYIEKKYKIHICLCSDGMHFLGGKVKNKAGADEFVRGLNESDYAALLKAFREQPRPPAYDNVASLFSDYARDRAFYDNRTVEIITYDPSGKASVTGGVFDGHNDQVAPRLAADIIGGGMGKPIAMDNNLAFSPDGISVIKDKHDWPDQPPSYHLKIPVPHLDQGQRRQLRKILADQFVGQAFREIKDGDGNGSMDSYALLGPARTQEEAQRERHIMLYFCRNFVPGTTVGPATQKLAAGTDTGPNRQM